MIKKILCLTDFSISATNASGYAAKLAQVLGAELVFVNVQTSMSAPVNLSFEDEEGGIVTQTVESRLIEMCNEVHKLFKIVTNYELDFGATSWRKIFSHATEAGTLIVTGSLGSHGLDRYLSGSNIFRFLKKAKCPVLVVPQNASYRDIGKIVFAWDYSDTIKETFSGLAGLVKSLDPEFVFLHVSTHKQASSHEVFTTMQHEMENLLEKDVTAKFERLFSASIPEGIQNYMLESNADLLALTYYNRNVFRALFHGEVARRFIETADYPVLVLHPEKVGSSIISKYGG